MVTSRPAESIAMRLAGAGVVGCLLVAAMGYAARPLLGTDALYPWKAVALLAAVVALAGRALRAHPFPVLGPANQVTLARAMLVALAVALTGEPRDPRLAALAIVVAATVAVLDGVDGYFARRSGMASDFGARFDVETDALMVLGLSALVWQYEKAGAWVLISGLLRYAFVAAGWVLPWVAGPLTPSLRGKTVAVAQTVGLSVALAPFVPVGLSVPVAAATVAALTWSFAVDVGRLWRQAHEGGG
jgi:phosphatidylglycerophosphate synthase